MFIFTFTKYLRYWKNIWTEIWPVQLSGHQGTGLPPVAGIQRVPAAVVVLPRAHHVPAPTWYLSTIMIKSWASRCPTWWWGRGSPGCACPRRRSCSAPRSSDSHTLQLLTSAQLDWGEPTFYFYLFWLTQNLPSRHNVDMLYLDSYLQRCFISPNPQYNFLVLNVNLIISLKTF